MENKINGSPYKMEQIPAKLFNSQYLSDVTFIIEDKPIYAHSLLLMVRSTVFQQQLESNIGEKKLIPISDYGYDVFYQLIRFLYTGQVDISDANWFQLMKLAKKYNVIRLIDHLNNHCSDMKMFIVYVLENYKIGLKTLNNAKFERESRIDRILRSDEFLSIHLDDLEEILNSNQIKEGLTELHIIDAMVRWMNHHCKQNQIQFSVCRQKFDHLIHLIRFPTMSTKELQSIQKKYPDLLTKSDLKEVAIHKICGAEYGEGMWNSIPRIPVILPYELKTYEYINCYIKFSVSSTMILGGLVLGEKEVYTSNQEKNVTINTVMYSNSSSYPSTKLGLGLLVKLFPNNTYKIQWSCENVNYWSRKPQTNLIVNAPSNLVNILEDHPNMLEILFLTRDGSTFD